MRRALVTGGSNGIGHALCKLLVEQKYDVHTFDITSPSEMLDAVTYHTVDITDGKKVQQAFRKINKKFNLIINNAGIMRRGTLFESSESEFELIMNVNVKGSWNIVRFGKPFFNRNATIVQMSSRHGMSLPTNPGLYGLSKQTVATLAEIIKKTYPGLTVKTLFPGPIDTRVAKEGRTQKEYHAVSHMRKSPEFLAHKIIDLIDSKYTQLVFDEKKHTYKRK